MTSGVSDVADDAGTATATKRRRGGTGLSAMLLPELQSLAASLGISGTARMRKGELITAISERQNGGGAATTEAPARSSRSRASARTGATESAAADGAPSGADQGASAQPAPATSAPAAEASSGGAATKATDTASNEQSATSAPSEAGERADRGGRDRQRHQQSGGEQQSGGGEQNNRGQRDDRGQNDRGQGERGQNDRGQGERGQRDDRGQQGDRGQRDDRGDRDQRNQRGDRDDRDQRGQRDDRGDRGDRNQRGDRDDDNDGGDGGRRSRRSRFRDRRRGRGDRDSDSQRDNRDPHVNDDDVLVPVAGIVDVLDNYAFVRTTGYLSGPNDVYVSMSQVKKHGLRRGDAVTGAVRATPRDGESRRDKYNPLVRLDTINGMEPEEARRRPEFYKLTPLYPQERLRLETEPHILTTRVIDLVMPIGKGQRALIQSPPKAGKTMVLQALANAITRNNPECHLMVVLVDERPEEVTDMQRTVKGEVIAATFDRPPQDHTTVAELAIERAKRLVELGHDVVVLLDSVTRLGRSYNLAAPASGRIMSGGIDSTALYPPKRFLGAARNIENGGSLTILATALVETGSVMDTVIFEEFKGTGNAELKLDRKIADKRMFPAVDVSASGTRKEEILLGKEELAVVHKLRKVLASLESHAALDLLLDRLKQSRTNIEFLMQITKSTPGE
ncbi:hypothetical protein GCM10012284_37200 [Mangrovihabitans endophyticus]|uniref:Transcription termination factor Rho n=2 Tax=Mangrovihabitans endophyticus TaxID=1751298 RepID=A0A8J3C2M1_9ACTN|nr:hypothetical protein GCM10012284_37200 [Mangrovihabitans endophyticus]